MQTIEFKENSQSWTECRAQSGSSFTRNRQLVKYFNVTCKISRCLKVTKYTTATLWTASGYMFICHLSKEGMSIWKRKSHHIRVWSLLRILFYISLCVDWTLVKYDLLFQRECELVISWGVLKKILPGTFLQNNICQYEFQTSQSARDSVYVYFVGKRWF